MDELWDGLSSCESSSDTSDLKTNGGQIKSSLDVGVSPQRKQPAKSTVSPMPSDSHVLHGNKASIEEVITRRQGLHGSLRSQGKREFFTM